jgi:redox-sensitive bicupin YhaK (pirin superfamily)
MLYRADKKNLVFDQGKFKVIGHQPGFSIPNYSDHGYGPLALIAESFMAPDTWIRLHPHHNDEIISWVPEGIMRHNDVTNGPALNSGMKKERWWMTHPCGCYKYLSVPMKLI